METEGPQIGSPELAQNGTKQAETERPTVGRALAIPLPFGQMGYQSRVPLERGHQELRRGLPYLGPTSLPGRAMTEASGRACIVRFRPRVTAGSRT